MIIKNYYYYREGQARPSTRTLLMCVTSERRVTPIYMNMINTHIFAARVTATKCAYSYVVVLCSVRTKHTYQSASRLRYALKQMTG